MQADDDKQEILDALAELAASLKRSGLNADSMTCTKAAIWIDGTRPEEQRKDAERYRWLREERDDQQPVVTQATFSTWGQPWRDVPLWGDELDAAVDKAMLDSPLPQSRSET